jgi:putative transcriptional regulator
MNMNKSDIEPDAGVILVASANLLDPNFSRSVILLCDHQYDGTFGLVLNNTLPVTMCDVVESIADWDAPLYRGGPVQENSLHFIHTIPDLDIGSRPITSEVFWGGDFDRLNKLIEQGSVDLSQIRFFVGYSGWGEGQLADEIKRDSWYLINGQGDTIFCDDSSNHWRRVVRTMGDEYEILANFPDDPRLN